MSARIDTSKTDTSTAALSIAGMNCASCVAHVSKAARSLPGVRDIAVNLVRGRATVTYNPAQTSIDQISARISQSGYSATPESSQPSLPPTKPDQSRKWLKRAIVGLVLWLPVECAHWLLTIFFPGNHSLHTGLIWFSLLTSTLCLLYVGSSFYRSAFNALLHRTTNMDTLIAMGSSVAYFYSLIFFSGGLARLWSPPSGDQLYFMESSALLALISLGHWLEANAKRAAGSAINALLELAPSRAFRLPDKPPAAQPHLDSSPQTSSFDFSHPQEVDVATLTPGDVVLVRPGDRVPVDGIVIEGASSIDESMITGESLPVTRTTGNQVIGGTINLDGRLVVRTTTIGADTALAQIVQLVEKAQESRPPVQKLADQISAVFVPVVLAIAMLTALSWFAWGTVHHWSPAAVWAQTAKTACSVLLIACPCALGLAVPAAIMVGTGLGARNGILIRDVDALQHAEKINTVVMDKTGTLTLGKPVVTHVIGGDQVLQLAAAAEQFSSHPVAKAIMRESLSRNLKIPVPRSFDTHPGMGVTATLDAQSIVVGNQAMLNGLQSPHPATGTIVYVAQKMGDQLQLLGQIQIADELKPDSSAAIAQLKSMGLVTILLTGDNLSAATQVAAQVKIDQIHADVKPAQKAELIRHLQKDPTTRVAMVGDGINDAPALAQASLGIAMGSGSDVARETGDIILINGSLMGVAGAIVLSRATMRTIRQNLFFAFIYNVLAIPLAATGFLHPVVAAVAMALSDITVIANSLRLRWVRISA